MSGYRIVKLAGGAHSVHSLAEAETFHPVIGPVAEAEALYVRQLRLVERLKQHTGEFVIWDVGLGAAANPLTVLRATRDLGSSIYLVSFDHTLEPLEFALQHAEYLGYLASYRDQLTRLLTSRSGSVTAAGRGVLTAPGAGFPTANGAARTPRPTCQHSFRDGNLSVKWEVHVGDFPALLTTPAAPHLAKPHAIMFDAFSPAKNPAMWTQALFASLFRLLDASRPCALPTYSRSTMLRVTLLLAGFFVGVGHATGEKEETTIAANTLDLIAAPLDRRWLQRAHRSTSAEPMWEPVYRQARLSPATWERLRQHPQFHG